ncbi:N-acetyltransferase [Piscinibacter gummiphilus]|uniref:Uncharacterized protein n=1 Tax=Piscinibacter gummiphilus TaxID=946333 RepID=A0A1W6LAG7_9BURK|nr:N-acetyltransferase [Piscinibacter gummiphilus]ARN21295.1 hypothetical protein A4W93_16080 [Piscinibacter gummiphilus]ATU65981.1 N-acetyltransferase [Piscinibacter gummiphilus]GLS93863.1 hypothetical protein GCM10007918_11540 [Piscinibacter gummiphilus]
MRIDVRLPPGQIELDLAALARRLPTLPGPLRAWRPADPSTATLLWRSAPSGVYVYVVPADRPGLAGYVAFARVPAPQGEVFSPHAKFAADHQRLGLATRIYQWMLDGGACLLSGARQSEASHRLWRSLGRSRPLRFAQVTPRALHDLGTEAPDNAFVDLDTRLLLLGRGRTVDSVVRRQSPAGSVYSNS